MSTECAKQDAVQKILLDMKALADPLVLMQAMVTEDVVGRILRSHLLIEQMVETFLKWTIAEQMKPVVKVPQQFSQKVVLATALGLPRQISMAANILNTIRNKVAHQIGAELEPADMQNFAIAVDRVRELFEDDVPPLEECSVEVQMSGMGKVKYGAQGIDWDFRIAAGMFIAWSMRYVISYAHAKVESMLENQAG